MSNRKKTPDLLGDILSNQQSDLEYRMEQPQQNLASVSQASDRLGVSETTIRKWASEFAGNLSQDANPGKGQPRYFGDEDMMVLTTIAQQRSANVSYEGIHKALENDRTVDSKLPADKLPDDQKQPTAPVSSQKNEDRIMRLESERDQLRMQLKATQVELGATREALATGQETETSMQDDLAKGLLPTDSKNTDRFDEPQAVPGRIITLEDQLKGLGKKPWWQVWKR